jgi:Zn-dependent alcohol dehydrogenase
MFCEIEIKGSLGCGLQDYPRIIEMARHGKLKIKELVTHKYKLDDINEGFKNMEKGDPSLIRSVVVMD